MSPRFGDQDPPKKQKHPGRRIDGFTTRYPAMMGVPTGELPSLVGVTGVYLIHFDKKLGHAQHYMGCAEDIAARMKKHKSGHGAKITKAVKEARINWKVVHVWPCKTMYEAEKLERQKKGYNTRQCPLCTPWEKVAA